MTFSDNVALIIFAGLSLFLNILLGVAYHCKVEYHNKLKEDFALINKSWTDALNKLSDISRICYPQRKELK